MNSVQLDYIRDAYNSLIMAFAWSETPQGHEYWSDVYDNLRRIHDEMLSKEQQNKNVQRNLSP